MTKKNNLYTKNKLKNVIFRIDFSEIQLDNLTIFNESIKDKFPIVTSEDAKKWWIQFDIKNNDLKKAIKNSKNWIYESKDKSKKINISDEFMWIEYSKYKDRKDLLNDVKIFENFIKLFDIKIINRIWLRYVNVIDNKVVKEQSDLKKHINWHLISWFDFIKWQWISRNMSNIIFKYDKCLISFHYWVFNKDFPNEITNPEFILDYDCYTVIPMNTWEIVLSEIIDSYNKYIQSMFEKSITKSMKDLIK